VVEQLQEEIKGQQKKLVGAKRKADALELIDDTGEEDIDKGFKNKTWKRKKIE